MQGQIIDISLPIENSAVVYPGNPAIEITEFRALPPGGTRLSHIALGSHAGTHVDAPAHVLADGAAIDQVSLEALVGTCRVIDLTHLEQAIGVADIENLHVEEGERILFKTRNSVRGLDHFYEDFIAIDGEAAEYLANKKVLSVGIDSWSVKPKGSNDQRPHTALLAKGIPIIEGIYLGAVEPGTYMLACLPLRIVGIDGAPARAILIRI